MTKKKKKKGPQISTVLLVLVLLTGLGILLYPTFSDFWNQYRDARLRTHYAEAVEELSDSEIDEELREAREYNAQHTENRIVDAFHQETGEYLMSHPYDQLLNPDGNEVMGYIEVPKIRLNLSIYHGIGSEALDHGAGHIEGTSLPIGGAGTHSVLAAHRGLPEAKLFTDLDQMKMGDMIYLHIMKETLAYQVDQIKTVLPEETEDLAILPGEDKVTLLTCTPYGVNTHRLLVRGSRVPYDEKIAPSRTPADIAAGIPLSALLLAGGLALLVVIFLSLFIRNRKRSVGED